MSASSELFLQERHIEIQRDNQHSKLITWNQLTSKKRSNKSTKKKSI